MSEIVGLQTVADELGVTKQRISQLVREGMPKLSHGKYDLAACKRWRSDYIEDMVGGDTAQHRRDIAEERARYYSAQADRAEFQLAKDREETVDAAIYEIALGNVVTELIISLDGWVDQASSADLMDLRRECAWSVREHLERTVESVCGNTASVQSAQSAGLRNRRQLR